jgi:hypothetical protein
MVMAIALATLLAGQAMPAAAPPAPVTYRCAMIAGDGSVLVFTLDRSEGARVVPASGSPWPARTVSAVPVEGRTSQYRVDDGGLSATLNVDPGPRGEQAMAELYERQEGENDLPLANGRCTYDGGPELAAAPRGTGPDLLARLAGAVRSSGTTSDCHIMTLRGSVTHVRLDPEGDNVTLQPLDANLWHDPVPMTRSPMPAPNPGGSIYSLTMIQGGAADQRLFIVAALFADLSAWRGTMLLNFYGGDAGPKPFGHCGVVRIRPADNTESQK